MSIFDDIRKDAEAGTPGPWELSSTESRILAMFSHGSFWEIANAAPTSFASDEDGRLIVAGGNKETNARRIARVPELERIALAAEELEQAIILWREARTVGDINYAHAACDEALDNYREATQ